MLSTLLRRVTVKTLDLVVDRGRRSSRAPVRVAATALDHARGVVGLRRVGRQADLPAWTGERPDQPMWESDRQKLRKHQLERGIIKEEADDATPVVTGPAITIYYKRSCPYTRAAMDLLREREIAFDGKDITGDASMLAWLKIVTGSRTTPQIFLHGDPIGGYDALRGLDQSGELRTRLAAGPSAAIAQEPDADDDLEIDVATLAERIDEGHDVLLLDVRTDAEVKSGVLAHAVHIALDALAGRMDELDPEGVWIAYCRSGQRSLTAASQLRARGFRSAASLAGGIEAWRAAGRAVVGPGDTAARRTPQRVKLPVLHPERSPFEGLGLDGSDTDATVLEGDALVQRVREVLDECRPLVQADGGDIELLDVQHDVVHVQLTGNCIGCPSSQATLKQGIERRLRTRIPQIKELRSPQLS